jgi:hypothetical protein
MENRIKFYIVDFNAVSCPPLLLALPESSLVLLPHVGPYSSNTLALGIYPTLSFLYAKKGELAVL